MGRWGRPLGCTLLALSACNALTGANDLAFAPCADCALDAAVARDGTADSSVVTGDASTSAEDVVVPPQEDAGDADASVDAGLGCQGAAACSRVVFVSSQSYTGDLGGVAGADAICTKLAAASTNPRIKGRTFRAWVGSSATSPAARLTHGTQAYIRADGALLASSWADLTDGNLGIGIAVDELGGPQNASAWTATSTDGAYVGPSCSDWTTMSFAVNGGLGNVGGSGPGWSSIGDDTCAATHNLYCFEE